MVSGEAYSPGLGKGWGRPGSLISWNLTVGLFDIHQPCGSFTDSFSGPQISFLLNGAFTHEYTYVCKKSYQMFQKYCAREQNLS